MQSPEIKPALDAIGFTADVTPVHEDREFFPSNIIQIQAMNWER